MTTLWLTAGLFHQMVEENLAGLAGVRQLLAGGDVLSVPHVRRVLAELPGTRLINGYGPTENTTFTCCYAVSDEGGLSPSVPVGCPIANTSAYVLDRHLAPVPLGVAGELFTGGDGLARGYLGRPERTAESFVPDPWGREPGGRLYRTGDLARWRPSGELEFLGRMDTQVKVRGFRVEPGEIEAALLAHPWVREAVVLAEKEGGTGRRLVAYLAGAPGEEPGVSELRDFLRRGLPEFMLPSAFAFLPSLPLTANGKVDRKALAELRRESGAAGEGAEPRTPLEELLAGDLRRGAGTGPGRGGGRLLRAGRPLAGGHALASRVRAAWAWSCRSAASSRRRRWRPWRGRSRGAGAGGDAPPLVAVPRERAAAALLRPAAALVPPPAGAGEPGLQRARRGPLAGAAGGRRAGRRPGRGGAPSRDAAHPVHGGAGGSPSR